MWNSQIREECEKRYHKINYGSSLSIITVQWRQTDFASGGGGGGGGGRGAGEGVGKHKDEYFHILNILKTPYNIFYSR